MDGDRAVGVALASRRRAGSSASSGSVHAVAPFVARHAADRSPRLPAAQRVDLSRVRPAPRQDESCSALGRARLASPSRRCVIGGSLALAAGAARPPRAGGWRSLLGRRPCSTRSRRWRCSRCCCRSPGCSRRHGVVGLVLYSLTILVRNIARRARGVPEDVRTPRRGMGYAPRPAALAVELPLALPAMFAGAAGGDGLDGGAHHGRLVVGNGGLGEPDLPGLREQLQGRGADRLRAVRGAGGGRSTCCCSVLQRLRDARGGGRAA